MAPDSSAASPVCDTNAGARARQMSRSTLLLVRQSSTCFCHEIKQQKRPLFARHSDTHLHRQPFPTQPEQAVLTSKREAPHLDGKGWAGALLLAAESSADEGPPSSRSLVDFQLAAELGILGRRARAHTVRVGGLGVDCCAVPAMVELQPAILRPTSAEPTRKRGCLSVITTQFIERKS
jgi:hypothetical protein